MTSPLAKEDLDDLRADGLKPTDEDVIRLHALACRISNGRETTAACAPRSAIAGGVVFWEPTVAAFQWYDYAKVFADNRTDEDWFLAFAFANGRRVGFLSQLLDEKDIKREVKAFLKNLCASKTEISRAVYYVSFGEDDIIPEKTEIAKKVEAAKTNFEKERESYSRVEEKLREAAVATGLTLEEIMTQPISRLQGMIYEYNIRSGASMSRSSARAHAEYLATLKAIRARLESERDAEKAKSEN